MLMASMMGFICATLVMGLVFRFHGRLPVLLESALIFFALTRMANSVFQAFHVMGQPEMFSFSSGAWIFIVNGAQAWMAWELYRLFVKR